MERTFEKQKMMKILNLWFSDDRMFIETTKNKVMSVAISRFPRLMSANENQKKSWKQYHDGLRWEDIDEDISLNSFFYADDNNTLITWN